MRMRCFRSVLHCIHALHPVIKAFPRRMHWFQPLFGCFRLSSSYSGVHIWKKNSFRNHNLLVDIYHAHSSPDAGEKEKCKKEEKENNCKGQRYCVEIILERNLERFSQKAALLRRNGKLNLENDCRKLEFDCKRQQYHPKKYLSISPIRSSLGLKYRASNSFSRSNWFIAMFTPKTISTETRVVMKEMGQRKVNHWKDIIQ